VKLLSVIVPGSDGVMPVIIALVTVPSGSVALTLPEVGVPTVVVKVPGQFVVIEALAHGFAAVALLRGLGAPVAKSVELLSVSVQPPEPRSTAVVLLGAGVGPAPSKQFAVVPKPTKSMMLAP